MNSLFTRFLPSTEVVLFVGPLALIYGWIVFSIVGHLRARRALRTAYTRKIFHFLIFTMATVVHLTWRLHGVVVFGAVLTLFVLYVVWRGEGHPFYEAIARPSDAPHRTMFILVPLFTTALGGFFSNVFFAPFAYVGYLVCGWGDAAAEPVGSRWGRHPYRVPSLSGVPAARSLEGSAAVFIIGSIAAMVGLAANNYSFFAAAAIGLTCGLAGAIVEAISNHGLDNLTTQVAASAVAWLLG